MRSLPSWLLLALLAPVLPAQQESDYFFFGTGCPSQSGVPILEVERGSFPNIGSPLRSPRDAWAWADTLDRYLGYDAEILVREYGPEIHGADRVRDMLTTVRDALRWLRAETLERLNAGMVIEDVVNDIEFPEEWAKSPWMPQTYGCPEYVIRDIWRLDQSSNHTLRALNNIDRQEGGLLENKFFDRLIKMNGDSTAYLLIFILNLYSGRADRVGFKL